MVFVIQFDVIMTVNVLDTVAESEHRVPLTASGAIDRSERADCF
jgi:hypothetical protein